MPDSAHNNLRLGESLHRLLHAYRRAMRDARRRTSLDLTVSEIRVLDNVHLFGEATVRNLAEAMDSDRGQVTRSVNKLQQQGLVSRRTNPADGRSPIIECTEAGCAVMSTITEIQREAADRMAAGLSDAEIEHFIAVADLMADSLNTTRGDSTP